MIHRCISDQTQRVCAKPFPEENIFIHCRRLELGFLGQVKYLERSLIRFEGNDLLVPVHDGTIGLDRSSNDLIVMFKVDNNDFRVSIFAEFLANANEVVGF
jgi:hypothetical protein